MNAQEATTCETLSDAVEQARVANQNGNGVGCTIPFRVEYDTFTISVVRKFTSERPRYFLFTVRLQEQYEKELDKIPRDGYVPLRVTEEIEAALGISDWDLTVELTAHGDRLTAMVPVKLF